MGHDLFSSIFSGPYPAPLVIPPIIDCVGATRVFHAEGEFGFYIILYK